jgi:hypothetical protein
MHHACGVCTLRECLNCLKIMSNHECGISRAGAKGVA